MRGHQYYHKADLATYVCGTSPTLGFALTSKYEKNKATIFNMALLYTNLPNDCIKKKKKKKKKRCPFLWTQIFFFISTVSRPSK